VLVVPMLVAVKTTVLQRPWRKQSRASRPRFSSVLQHGYLVAKALNAKSRDSRPRAKMKQVAAAIRNGFE